MDTDIALRSGHSDHRFPCEVLGCDGFIATNGAEGVATLISERIIVETCCGYKVYHESGFEIQ